tara:strand:- start:254 stop:457 length:204 start_codon:yes stop_codon:yes gene_type:complete
MYLHGVYVHINLLFEGFSVMKGAVGIQGETGGSLPLVVVANATNAKLKAGIKLIHFIWLLIVSLIQL